MDLIEYIVKREMNRSIVLGEAIFEKNWLWTRGCTDSNDIEQGFNLLVENNPDWEFGLKDISDVAIKINWKRKPRPTLSDQVRDAAAKGELFDDVTIVV